MKSVLVFGGSGFLGSYIVNELASRNFIVTIADLISSNNSSEFIFCDILNENDINKVFSNKKFDIVFNLAGFANLEKANLYPLETMNLNIISNINIIENCIKHNIEKFVFASSAYAMSEKGSFYGISKLASEKIIEEYNKKKNLNFIIIRYGSVYSERAFENNYIYNLIEEAIKTNKIDHNGDGKEFREYIHANDAAKLSVDLITNKEYDNKHIILTGSKGIKRKDLFNMINEIMGDSLIINYFPENNSQHYKYTPYSFQSSISKNLIPNPQIDLGQGILECIRAINEK